MVKNRKVGLGTFGCLSIILGGIVVSLGGYVIKLIPVPDETQAMMALGAACLTIILVGAGIIMMIIGFFRRSRERAETAEAERLVRITRKAEQMMAENEMRDEE